LLMKARTPYGKFAWLAATLFSLAACLAASALGPSTRAHQAGPQQSSTPAPDAALTRTVGTVKAIAAATVTLTLDTGGETTVALQDATKILRVAPGQKDLKQATPIAIGDLQPGDRILVRGKPADDGKSLAALSVIVMAKTDVAAKQANDREAWQKHGLGGIVSAVDPATATITIGVTVAGEKKTVLVKIAKDTVLRRYAPDSVKFDEAVPATLDKVKPGDQLRARGMRSPDGGALAADEIVSGTFRNIAGTITKTDPAAGTLIVQDLTTKKPVTVKITKDSQLRKLSAPVAQRIAVRLKGESAPPDSAGAGTPPAAASKPKESAGRQSGASGSGGPGGQSAPARGDLQQMILNMPPTTLAEIQKGDAVMIVATEGTDSGGVTAIILLAGVEPILQASGQASLLSPWSLGGAPGGDSGTP
jgi:hypothetical protein